MTKSREFLERISDSKADGYLQSYEGWKSIINRATNEVMNSFKKVNIALDDDPKAMLLPRSEKTMQMALGSLDASLDSLIKAAKNTKKLNAQILSEITKES